MPYLLLTTYYLLLTTYYLLLTTYYLLLTTYYQYPACPPWTDNNHTAYMPADVLILTEFR